MSRRRIRQIVIRLTDEEFARIKKKVAASGMRQQEYLLRAILNQRIVSTDGLKELVPQLKRIGVNLNQLTRLANAGFPIEAEALQSIRLELNEQWRLLKQYTQKQS